MQGCASGKVSSIFVPKIVRMPILLLIRFEFVSEIISTSAIITL